MIVTSSGKIIAGSKIIINDVVNEFLGAVNNLWNNPANWSLGIVPAANHIAIIKANCNINITNITLRKLIVEENFTLQENTGVNISSMVLSQGLDVKGVFNLNRPMTSFVGYNQYSAGANSLRIAASGLTNTRIRLEDILHDVNFNQLLEQEFYNKLNGNGANNIQSRFLIYKNTSNGCFYKLNSNFLTEFNVNNPILQINSSSTEGVIDLNGCDLFLNNLFSGSFNAHRNIINSHPSIISNLILKRFATGRSTYNENNINLIFSNIEGCTIYSSESGSVASDIIRFNRVEINSNLHFDIQTLGPNLIRNLIINPYDKIIVANGVTISMDVNNVLTNSLEFQNTVEFGSDVIIDVKGVNTFVIGDVVYNGAAPTLISSTTAIIRYNNTITRDIIPINYGILELIGSGQKRLIANTTCHHLYFSGTATLDLNGYIISGYTKYTDDGNIPRTVPNDASIQEYNIIAQHGGAKTLTGNIVCNLMNVTSAGFGSSYINYNGFTISATVFHDMFNRPTHVGGVRDNIGWANFGGTNAVTLSSPITIKGSVTYAGGNSSGVTITGGVTMADGSTFRTYAGGVSNQWLPLGISSYYNLNLLPIFQTIPHTINLRENIVVRGTYTRPTYVTINKNGFTIKDANGNDLE